MNSTSGPVANEIVSRSLFANCTLLLPIPTCPSVGGTTQVDSSFAKLNQNRVKVQQVAIPPGGKTVDAFGVDENHHPTPLIRFKGGGGLTRITSTLRASFAKIEERIENIPMLAMAATTMSDNPARKST